MKVRMKIDHREVEADSGSVLIDVLRGEGIRVPSMCYLEGMEHNTSCMVCVVKDRRTGKLIPSCSHRVEDGMDIISGDGEVHEARKMSLELLLSEHVGDCEAPCQVTCPAHMDIPLMNRLLAAGKFREALQVVKKDIALPSVLGRICPAPCEGACRRKSIDQAVSICLLKRFAGDHDLAGDRKYLPFRESPKNKRVAVIGAGPAG
ncbi:MAG TPA: 2Fe-2S iron-sulfur cluster binding domain-containing protein, partial [Bacteroides sp.]|nr:2Fe-2S iron-sulfur cluster binding domain-containing protein [Bacteroides sp.]